MMQTLEKLRMKWRGLGTDLWQVARTTRGAVSGPPHLWNFANDSPRARSLELVSTVLEQDHFCSDYLVPQLAVLTNSRNRDDEIKHAPHGKVDPLLF